MNSIFNLPRKVLCLVATAILLSSCGATSTVSPLRPVRVIGLGDAYNDVRMDTTKPYTVSGTTTVATVVEQLAVYFGVGMAGTYVNDSTYTSLPASGIFSYAMGDALISGTGAADASLTEQVDRLLADVGNSFAENDLILIAVGTRDIKAGTDKVTAVTALTQQVNRLLNAKAKHVLVMQPLDLAKTPYGKGAGLASSLTQKFIEEELSQLNKLVSSHGYTTNPVIFTNATSLSSDFGIYTGAYTSYGIFSTSTQTPACQTAPANMVGCAVTDAPNHATSLFADNLNLTPAGNRWVAQYVYNATGQGWR